jgi:hypothetical protein
VEPVDLTPQRQDRRLVDPGECSGRVVRADGLAARPHHHERVAAPGAARGDELGDVHAGPRGEQGDEPLVLDQLEPAQPGRSLHAAVPGQAPHVGEQLGVPRVPPVHLDEQGSGGVGALEQQDALRLHRCLGEGVDVDSQLGEGEADARRRRAAAR